MIQKTECHEMREQTPYSYITTLRALDSKAPSGMWRSMMIDTLGLTDGDDSRVEVGFIKVLGYTFWNPERDSMILHAKNYRMPSDGA